MSSSPALIPVEEFFTAPSRTRARISPDGTKIAYLAPWRDRLNVFVRASAGGWPETESADDPASWRATSEERRSIDEVWGNPLGFVVREYAITSDRLEE